MHDCVGGDDFSGFVVWNLGPQKKQVEVSTSMHVFSIHSAVSIEQIVGIWFLTLGRRIDIDFS